MLKTLLSLALAILTATSVNAQVFYATNNMSATNFGTAGDELVIYKYGTSNWVSVGVIGGGITGFFSGLDWAEGNGSGPLIGSVIGGNTVGEVYAINPVNANATLLGNAPENLIDLAYRELNQKMYGTAYTVASSTLRLYVDDDGDSVPETLVASTAILGPCTGLGFDANGDMFLVDPINNVILKSVALSLAATIIQENLPFNLNLTQGLYVEGNQGFHAAFRANDDAENYDFDTNVPGTYAFRSEFATDAGSGMPEVVAGDLTRIPNFSDTVFPDSLNIFRGILIDGQQSDVNESDDQYAKFHPGPTLNTDEAPVWLIFEGSLPMDSPPALEIKLEAAANTVGLSQRIEVFNWNTGQFDVVGTGSASFNSDSTIIVDLGANVSDYVEENTGKTKARIGWKATGPILLFPWTVRVDQMGWRIGLN